MRELVSHDHADLVAVVAVEQRVEQDHPLGRAEPGDVGVGAGGASARVDRVHLPHLDAGRPRQLEHVGPRLPLGERGEVVEQRRQQHRGSRAQERPRNRGSSPRGEPPAAGVPAHDRDYRRPGTPGECGFDRRRLEQIERPAPPRLGDEANGDRPPACEDRQRQPRYRGLCGERRSRDRPAGELPPPGLPARGRQPPACRRDAGETGPRLWPASARERGEHDQFQHRARQRQPCLRPGKARATLDFLAAEIGSRVDVGGLDRALARSEQPGSALRRDHHQQHRTESTYAW